MKTINILKKSALLFLGLFLYSVGILFLVHANLGPAPWEVFQIGIMKHTGLTLGRVGQIVGLIIILIDVLLKEIPGWGTLANMYFIGFFVDLIQKYNLIHDATNMGWGILMTLAGIIITGWGTFFYINTGLGAGPRDGLMLGLSRKLSVEVWKARTAIEVSVVIAGMLLGTYPGLGTVAFAILIGPAVQLVYRIGKREPKAVKHRTLVDDYVWVKSMFKKEKVEA